MYVILGCCSSVRRHLVEVPEIVTETCLDRVYLPSSYADMLCMQVMLLWLEHCYDTASGDAA